MLQLIFLIVFPFAVYKAWKNVQLAKLSTGWPTTTGRITAAETMKVMFRRQPRMTYSYSVNGAPFTSQRISFAGGYKPKEIDAILARYPVGKKCRSPTLRRIPRKRPWRPERRNKSAPS